MKQFSYMIIDIILLRHVHFSERRGGRHDIMRFRRSTENCSVLAQAFWRACGQGGCKTEEARGKERLQLADSAGHCDDEVTKFRARGRSHARWMSLLGFNCQPRLYIRIWIIAVGRQMMGGLYFTKSGSSSEFQMVGSALGTRFRGEAKIWFALK